MKIKNNIKLEKKIMGARTQVKIKTKQFNNPIYLYAHWGANGPTLDAVKTAISRNQRWNDAEYFSRIVFCELIKHDISGETGFGISDRMHGDLQELIVIDIDNKKLYYISGYGEVLEDVDNGDYEKTKVVNFNDLILTKVE